jgi:predicted transcriptional regulator
MSATTIKDEARKLVESLAEDATWDDLMYQIYVRQAIEDGIRDADEGRLVETAQVRAEFGLSP